MDKNLIKLIIENWSQITVILGVIGFIFKTFIDWRLKKQEIKFQHLQLNKKAEVKEFYKNYFELERKLKEYLFITANHMEEQKPEVRQELLLRFERFDLSFYHIRLFLPNKDLKLLDEIKEELKFIHLQIELFEMGKIFKPAENDLVLKLRRIRDEIFPKKLPALFKRIEDNLRKDYGIN